MINLKLFLVLYSSTILTKIVANENITDDDNKKQISVSTNECRPTLDVIFLLDTSHSVKDIFKDQVQWANALVSLLPVSRDGVHVGAIQYAGLPLVEFALNTYTTAKDVQDHMKNIEHRSGVTRTGAALRKSKDEFYNPLRGGRLSARKLVILMTDGVSIDDPQTMAEQMRKENNITIMTVALSNDSYLPELSAITGNESLCFRNSDLIMLKAHVLNILKEVLNKCRLENGDISLSTITTVATISAATANATATAITTTSHQPVTSTRSTLNSEYLSFGTTLTAQLSIKSLSKQSTSSFTSTTTGVHLETSSAKSSTTPHLQALQTSTVHSSPSATTQQLTTLSNTLSQAEKGTVPSYVTTATTKVASKPLVLARLGRKCILAQSDSNSESLDSSDCLDGDTSTRTIVDEIIPSKNLTVIDSTKLAVKINTTKNGPCPLNVLFMLDSSSSTAEDFNIQKQIIKDVIDLLTLDPKFHRIAMMQFSGYLMQQPVISFDPYQSNYFITDAIDNLQQLSGTSYIGAAFTFARNMLYRRKEDTKTILFLISDGYSQDDAVQPAEILKSFYNADIYTLTMSKEHDRSYLSRIAGSFDNVFIGDYQLQYFKESFKKKLINCSFHN